MAADGRSINCDYLHEFSALDAVPAEEDCEVIAGELPFGGVDLEGLVLLLIK